MGRAKTKNAFNIMLLGRAYQVHLDQAICYGLSYKAILIDLPGQATSFNAFGQANSIVLKLWLSRSMCENHILKQVLNT